MLRNMPCRGGPKLNIIVEPAEDHVSLGLMSLSRLHRCETNIVLQVQRSLAVALYRLEVNNKVIFDCEN